MDLNLLEAKSALVTLHLNAMPFPFDIIRQAGQRVSLRGRKSGISEMLVRGMKCVVEFRDQGKETLTIDRISENREWLTLECMLKKTIAERSI